MIQTVTKRDGTIAPFDYDKCNQWSIWSSQNCEGVHWSEVVLKAVRTLHEGIATTDLHQALVDACLSFRTEGYTQMAARLTVGVIYKEAFDDFSVPPLAEYYHEMVENGQWRDMDYSEEELQALDMVIDHTLDFTYAYATVKQFYDKYSVKSYGVSMESPQMAFMGLAMSNMSEEGPDRITDVISAYHREAKMKINLPTPTVVLERTPQLPAPSCCVISANDGVDSIGAATQVAYDMTAASSGIGVELRTRAPKDPVKNGKIEHGGKHSYYSLLDRAVKANAQMTRGGSATVTYNALDPEILSLLTLGQHRTDDTYKIATLDYSFAINHLFLKKVAKNDQWMTISPLFADKLWNLSYSGDQQAFEAEYNRLLSSKNAKMVNAREVFAKWVTARGDTGRCYLTLLDNMNSMTPFLDPIRQSNLCLEIGLPTEGFDGVADLFKSEAGVPGEVALCSLGSVVVSQIESPEDHEETVYTLAKIIDNTIEKSVYPFPHVERTARARRSIGVGMTDLAHEMAKRGLKYDTDEGRTFMHELAEDQAFYLLKASVRLAKERGPCEWMHKTKYGRDIPWLPIDEDSSEIDKWHSATLRHDWEGLRADIKKYGVRFSVESAFMPTESSSLLTNSTNSIYPIRKLEQYKASRKGMVYFRAPGMDTLSYQSAYEIDQMDMVRTYGIFQKFTTQGISADFWTKLDGEDQRLSMKEMLQRVFHAAKVGMKTFYYENFLTGGEASEMVKQEELKVEEMEGDDCCKL